ncbi:uncharacterized protein LOC131850490 [Achroia grisella]|uniref:uncharacterized protein LOC131850490 n=1 Tax=Achroia grisella TaxID=688607 RepID=UPI0027D26181|nr:uncharacterized protein LOC131850490 [Achroia grisella]
MWTLLKNQSSFYMTFSSRDDYEVLVTNFITLWTSNYNESSLLTSLKNSNQLEIRDQSLIEKGIDMLSNTNSLKNIEINQEGNTLNMCMVKAYEYSVKLHLTLVEASKELFFQKITQPLLKIIVDMKTSENQLRHFLRNKDHLKRKYDDETHMRSHQEFESIFGDSKIPECILQKMNSFPHTNYIKEENGITTEREHKIHVKSEPDSQTNSRTPITIKSVNIKKEIVKTEAECSPNAKTKRKKLNL